MGAQVSICGALVCVSNFFRATRLDWLVSGLDTLIS